jgi:hypothetical protein
VWAFLACWFPLNPLTLFFLWHWFQGRVAVTFAASLAGLRFLAATICGPFTGRLEGRNPDFCWNVAWQMLPVCFGALAVAFLVQLCWRPRSATGAAIRMLIWMAGWWVWFAGGMVSVFLNLG